MHKEILEQPDAVERVLRGRLDERFATAHLGGLNMDAREARAIRRVKILGCGSAYYVGQMGAHADRGAGPDPRRRRAGLRVPLPQPGRRARHPLRRGQPVRRDHRHPARGPGDPAQGRPGDRPGQRGRLRDRPRVRRRHLPARRARGRGRVDQGADQHVPRLRAARAPPRPGPRPVHRRRQAADRGPDQAARADRGDPRPGGRAGRDRDRGWPRPRACSSSAGSAATRSPARARRSSRRSPTGTPRPTRPPSSSTARSR